MILSHRKRYCFANFNCKETVARPVASCRESHWLEQTHLGEQERLRSKLQPDRKGLGMPEEVPDMKCGRQLRAECSQVGIASAESSGVHCGKCSHKGWGAFGLRKCQVHCQRCEDGLVS